MRMRWKRWSNKKEIPIANASEVACDRAGQQHRKALPQLRRVKILARSTCGDTNDLNSRPSPARETSLIALSTPPNRLSQPVEYPADYRPACPPDSESGPSAPKCPPARSTPTALRAAHTRVPPRTPTTSRLLLLASLRSSGTALLDPRLSTSGHLS